MLNHLSNNNNNKVNRKAADLLSIVVFVADGHLKVRDSAPFPMLRRRKSNDISSELTTSDVKTARFFYMMKRIPFDVQMVICARLAELKSDYVAFRFLNPALQEVARFASVN